MGRERNKEQVKKERVEQEEKERSPPWSLSCLLRQPLSISEISTSSIVLLLKPLSFSAKRNKWSESEISPLPDKGRYAEGHK